MLWKKTGWFWKSGFIAISFMLMLSVSGCSDTPPKEASVSETVIDVQTLNDSAKENHLEKSQEDAEEIINICIGLYEKAAEENKLADLETIRSIVNRLGENGYPAVDSKNQIDMTEAEQVVQFCEKVDAQEEAAEQWVKGYDLPVDGQERKEAETDCKKRMELYAGIYESADKGTASNVVLNDETLLEMQKEVKNAGYPVTTMVTYSNMENYESVDRFLEECMEGKRGSVVIYEVHNDGGLGRMKFIFDGTDMYVVSTRGIWNADNKPGISYISYTRIKEWSYTEKGWFCYELCVPEPPEVSEIMDGSCLIRIKPMTEEQREMSERCVKGLGYQGNNILCSNWNADHMEELDFNGMYEYLYAMKYGDKFNSEDYPNGIPKEEFEGLIMEYLPVTAEQIQEYAVFDEESQTYPWARLGCFNYAPTFFGTSLPEVTDIKENEDGTVTLTVEAVCDMVICDDAVITHELTVRFAEDGSFQYLGNEILNDGIMNIPDYQYRIREE